MTTPESQVMNAIIQDAQDAIELATGEKYLLKPVKMNKTGPITLNGIVNAVAHVFGLERREIINKGRTDEVAFARHAVCYLAYKVYKVGSLNYIGLHLSGRNHATIMHSIKTCKNMMDTKKVFKNRVDRCIESLEN